MNADALTADMRLVYEALRDGLVHGGGDPWQAHLGALAAVRNRWAREMSEALQLATESIALAGPPRWEGRGVAHFFESGSPVSRCGRPRSWTPSRARACKRCVKLLAGDLTRCARGVYPWK